MPDINEICKTAWDSTKKEHQPAYDTLEQSYKEMLINRAGAVQGTGEVSDGPFAAFDAQVAGQLGVEPVADVPPEVKEELAEEVVAEAGEPVAIAPPAPVPEPEKEHLDPKGQLPGDFPAREKLHEAGINTYGQLAKIDDLSEIDGIGPATVKTILKRVRADTKALNK